MLVDGGATIIDLQRVAQDGWNKPSAALVSVLAIAEGGADALDLANEAMKKASQVPQAKVARARAKLHAPIPNPPQIRDFLCFEQHLLQGFATARKVRAQNAPDPGAAMREMEEKGILSIPSVWYERPIFYHPNRLNIIGTDDQVLWPAYSNALDFELEFGCYIGKAGKDISRESARDHIFGYTIFNDMSARDEQMKDMPGQLGPGKGKNFDTSNVMGPCLVTADELKDPYNLDMIACVDGEEWGRGNSRDMHWKFEDLIAHISRSETLVPGEFLGSGTVGNGCGLEQMRFLKPGNLIELEVQGIGVLRSKVDR